MQITTKVLELIARYQAEFYLPSTKYSAFLEKRWGFGGRKYTEADVSAFSREKKFFPSPDSRSFSGTEDDELVDGAAHGGVEAAGVPAGIGGGDVKEYHNFGFAAFVFHEGKVLNFVLFELLFGGNDGETSDVGIVSY